MEIILTKEEEFWVIFSHLLQLLENEEERERTVLHLELGEEKEGWFACLDGRNLEGGDLGI